MYTVRIDSWYLGTARTVFTFTVPTRQDGIGLLLSFGASGLLIASHAGYLSDESGNVAAILHVHQSYPLGYRLQDTKDEPI